MHEDQGKHYRFVYRGVKLDPARIQRIYGIDHPMQISIHKKVLRAGTAHKTLEQDICDIITAAERWLEMIEEEREDARQKHNPV